MNVFEMFHIEVVSDEDRVGKQGQPRTSYETERYIFGLIREGDTAAVQRLLLSLYEQPVPMRIGKMSKNDLRQAQYLAISIVALGTRQAIEGGLRESEAYRLSDEYIQQIDQKTDAAAIFQLCFEIMMQLTQKVRDSRDEKIYSPPIRRAVAYISENPGTALRAEQIAAHCGLSAGYLSAQFKRETGVHLTQYIRRQKTALAKRLIRSGALTDGEIALRLGYCSQSYFIRCFRQETAMTPRQYRLEGL